MDLHLFDLNLLVALDALLRECNVTQAGNRLNLSQPAMSGALARLRSHFHDELLVPAGRRMIRTPLGDALIEPVGEILLRVRGMVETRKSFEPAASTRHFTIACSDYVVAVLLSDVIRRVRREAPGMTFEVRSLGRPADEALENGELDFLIAPPASDLDAHRSEVLFEDTFTCVAWSENTRVGASLTLEEYLDLGHVIVNVGGDPVGNIDEVYLRKTKLRRRVEASVPSFALAPLLVVGTDRIGTIASRLAARCAEFLPLKVVPLPIEIVHLVEVLHWHRVHDSDPAHDWLRGIFRDMVASMPSMQPESDAESRPRRVLSAVKARA